MAVTDSLKDTIVLETSGVTRENLGSALSMVEGCWKSSSLLWMQANGFPVLPGLILGGWTQASQEAVDGFCRGRNVSGLLVRIEKPGQRWTRRRGGYIISADRARELVEELRREGMIALLLEPASPYMDLFSLTSVSDLDTGKVEAEVVGHGFDASDILRGDITPHERFEISFDPGRAQSKLSTKFRAKRTFIIKPETYRASVQRRLIKIGARLRSP